MAASKKRMKNIFSWIFFVLSKKKKYLLVIDDVWTTNLWIAIEKALPKENNGSRILMTTRISEVAKEADPIREPYKLSFLTKKSGSKLFLKYAFRNWEIQIVHPNLVDLANQFVSKCGGLPLALVVLGGLLAKKQPTYHAWSKVMQIMNWHSNEQKVCIEIIKTSYDDLSLALKSCFMYFATFSEDYQIDVPSLLWMWIAEGFIPHEKNRTLEDTTESFLEDLVQRSMVQVLGRSVLDDSITCCQIHDLLRDVATQEVEDNNFLTVCSILERVQSCGQAHCVAIHNLNHREWMKYASPNLRTLLCFNDTWLSDCSRHRLLKVLSATTSHSTKHIDMQWFEKLSQLRYVKLKYPGNVMWNQVSFEKWISQMKFMQTLYIGFIFDSYPILPSNLWHIKTLRHVIIGHKTLDISGLPPTIDLANLQTLLTIKPYESWNHTNLPNLTNLRVLGIVITEGLPWEVVIAFLHTLKDLVGLAIRGEDIPTVVVDTKKFPFYEHLTSLTYFSGQSFHDFDITMFPTHLTRLAFYNSKLQQDHMAVVEKLQGFKVLELHRAYPNQAMKCSVGGFSSLQELSFYELKKLEEWEIEEGAMPMLKDLSVFGSPIF